MAQKRITRMTCDFCLAKAEMPSGSGLPHGWLVIDLELSPANTLDACINCVAAIKHALIGR